MLRHIVQFPLGCVEVALERRGLALGDRGGFEACWFEGNVEALEPESFRRLVKLHLQEVYLEQEKTEPASVILNLTSHQLLEDLIGWTKLNYAIKHLDD